MKDKIKNRINALTPEKKALFDQQLKKHAEQSIETDDESDKSTENFPFLPKSEAPNGNMEFSFLFFSSDGASDEPDKYRLLLECAQYADVNGFAAIWTPERHFNPFGGLYPNPAVISAALAMHTDHIQLRAGSVVLPLQHPLRVVEEWSVVDNLSNGRVAIAFASGWLADDFVLAPNNYDSRKAVMFEEIKTVRKLWQGKTIAMNNGLGESYDVRIYPTPVQKNLTIWVTATGKNTFVEAGKTGANVLTGLMEQGIEQCAECIKAYRQALAENGHDPASGKVAIMLHTYLGEKVSEVKETVRGPFSQYLHSFLRMTKTQLAHEVPETGASRSLAEQDQQALLDFAFERYFNTRALFGTPQSCISMITSLQKIGVDEIACLLDFGLDKETVLNGLDYLHQLKTQFARPGMKQQGVY